MTEHDPASIGIVSISDRASSGVYEDKGLPALKRGFHPERVQLAEHKRGLVG